FGDPVGGSTIAALCVFNDAGAQVGELIVDRAGQTCGTKPCWKPTGKQGLAYQDKMASAAGVTKIGFVGGAVGKGKAKAQGKNNAAKGLTSLPTGLSAALTGNTSPTIELVTSDGLCVGAKMNRVVKDEALRYKAQKKKRVGDELAAQICGHHTLLRPRSPLRSPRAPSVSGCATVCVVKRRRL